MSPAETDTGPDSSSDTDDDVRTVAGWIDEASAITVLTGAGISTDSGIPDFRGPNGVWTKNPAAEKQATLQNYLADPEVRVLAWRARMDHRAWGAEPNDGHRALVQLERRRKLVSLLTQNVDGLHHDAGSDPDKIVEVHGTIREAACLECDYRADMGVGARPGAARRGRPAVSGVRRDSQERHDQLRPAARGAGSAACPDCC